MKRETIICTLLVFVYAVSAEYTLEELQIFIANNNLSTQELEKLGERIIPDAFLHFEDAPAYFSETIDLNVSAFSTSTNFYNLHSRPTSKKTINLDFDGYYLDDTAWLNVLTLNKGKQPFFCDNFHKTPISSWSSTQRESVWIAWWLTSHFFSMFDVDVTTEIMDKDHPKLVRSNDTDDAFGFRVVITANCSSKFAPGINGITLGPVLGQWWGAIRNGSESPPLFIFSDVLMYGSTIGNTIAHESGHYLGLAHDGYLDGLSVVEYYAGHPVYQQNPIAALWVPLMGKTRAIPYAGWSKGDYYGANNKEDDLQIIKNKLGYSLDDHGNTPNESATELRSDQFYSAFYVDFVITDENDIDCFKFLISNGNVNIQQRFQFSGALLQFQVYDSNQNLLFTSTNPATFNNINPWNQITVSPTYFGWHYICACPQQIGDPMANPAHGIPKYSNIGRSYWLVKFSPGPSLTTSTAPPTTTPSIYGERPIANFSMLFCNETDLLNETVTGVVNVSTSCGRSPPNACGLFQRNANIVAKYSVPAPASKPFTVCLWRNVTSSPGGVNWDFLRIGSANEWLRFTADGILYFLTVSNNGVSTETDILWTSFKKNTLYHFCFIVDKTTVKLYINGNYQSAITNSMAMFTKSSYTVFIGGVNADGLHSGMIDDVEFFERVLTNAEILAVFGLPAPCPQPMQISSSTTELLTTSSMDTTTSIPRTTPMDVSLPVALHSLNLCSNSESFQSSTTRSGDVAIVQNCGWAQYASCANLATGSSLRMNVSFSVPFSVCGWVQKTQLFGPRENLWRIQNSSTNLQISAIFQNVLLFEGYENSVFSYQVNEDVYINFTNPWHYCFLVTDQVWTLYIDGEFYVRTEQYQSLSSTTFPWIELGGASMSLADFKIFPVELSPEQIWKVYNNPSQCITHKQTFTLKFNTGVNTNQFTILKQSLASFFNVTVIRIQVVGLSRRRLLQTSVVQVSIDWDFPGQVISANTLLKNELVALNTIFTTNGLPFATIVEPPTNNSPTSTESSGISMALIGGIVGGVVVVIGIAATVGVIMSRSYRYDRLGAHAHTLECKIRF